MENVMESVKPELRENDVPVIVSVLKVIGCVEVAASVFAFLITCVFLSSPVMPIDHPGWIFLTAAGGLLNSTLWFALAFGLKCLNRIAQNTERSEG